MDKQAMYELMNQQLEGLLKATPYRISGLANASALLWETLENINWAGFYLMEEGKLILGPFQGKVACTEIGIGRGVCGTAVEKDEVLVVDMNLRDILPVTARLILRSCFPSIKMEKW